MPCPSTPQAHPLARCAPQGFLRPRISDGMAWTVSTVASAGTHANLPRSCATAPRNELLASGTLARCRCVLALWLTAQPHPDFAPPAVPLPQLREMLRVLLPPHNPGRPHRARRAATREAAAPPCRTWVLTARRYGREVSWVRYLQRADAHLQSNKKRQQRHDDAGAGAGGGGHQSTDVKVEGSAAGYALHNTKRQRSGSACSTPGADSKGGHGAGLAAVRFTCACACVLCTVAPRDAPLRWLSIGVCRRR